jgi:hypothetical protein
MKKPFSVIALAAILSLTGSQWAFGYNGIPWYQDPCYTNWVTSNCISSATMEITKVSISPTNVVCLGTELSASAQTTNLFGRAKYDHFFLAQSVTNGCTN